MTTAPNDQVLRLRAIRSERCAASDRNTCARSSESAVGAISRSLGISEQSYYRWRREYGGLKVSQARRLKDLEKENQRLRKAVSELAVETTHDAGTPLVSDRLPLLTIDVWEHAYYLDRKNDRKAYVEAVLERTLNWDFALANLVRKEAWTYPA